jgi:3-dehydroquinate dehydratase-2
MRFLIINGPNINMLGVREPEIYGTSSYNELVWCVVDACNRAGVEYECYQTNHEGDIIEKIQRAYKRIDGIIINPAGYTHTSIAIADALKAVAIPAVEVHLTDVDSREEYRRVSYIRDVCIKTITGKGFDGYAEAVSFLCDYLTK